jgi:ER-bound oxygenase mpaB/B'/Rubber oxygenase, catalytic domain
MRESRWLREIQALDPERDCRRIVFLDAFYEFPFDTARALELAFFKTFASPSIATLLDSTGEFVLRGQKRYDDTDLLMSAFSEDGWAGEQGKRALRRMNQIHGRFAIANEDFLYVLSAMVLEPLRWNERFGWRRLVEAERLAQFHFWREIGRRMAIEEIPESLVELERFNVAYEGSRFAVTEEGSRLARAQRDVFLAWFPLLPHRLGARAISSLLEEHVVEALGLVRPTGLERRAAERALRLRALLLRPLPARRRPQLRTTMRRRSYPAGYTIEHLGPFPAAEVEVSPGKLHDAT